MEKIATRIRGTAGNAKNELDKTRYGIFQRGCRHLPGTRDLERPWQNVGEGFLPDVDLYH